MTTIIGIDPGPKESAFVTLWRGEPQQFGKIENERLLDAVRCGGYGCDVMAIEMVASFGMAVGAEVFETVFWSGRLVEAWSREWHRVYRKDVKLHLCYSPRAKDGNIRRALIDRFGGEVAIGRKKMPGPLYGISGDCWSALAVAIVCHETILQPAS